MWRKHVCRWDLLAPVSCYLISDPWIPNTLKMDCCSPELDKATNHSRLRSLSSIHLHFLRREEDATFNLSVMIKVWLESRWEPVYSQRCPDVCCVVQCVSVTVVFGATVFPGAVNNIQTNKHLGRPRSLQHECHQSATLFFSFRCCPLMAMNLTGWTDV